jgi:hypothetical protein
VASAGSSIAQALGPATRDQRDPTSGVGVAISPVRINAVTLMSTSGSDWQRLAVPAAGTRDTSESFGSLALWARAAGLWPKPL